MLKSYMNRNVRKRSLPACETADFGRTLLSLDNMLLEGEMPRYCVAHQMLQYRGNIKKAITREINQEICQLNNKCKEEIGILTARLLMYLKDIKHSVQVSSNYDGTIQKFKAEWDMTIQHWKSDVRTNVDEVREAIVTRIIKGVKVLVGSRKFSNTQIQDFVSSQTTIYNQLAIVNETTYSEVEVNLEHIFEAYVQNWLVVHSFKRLYAPKKVKSVEILTESSSSSSEDSISLRDDQSVETLHMLEEMQKKLTAVRPDYTNTASLKNRLEELSGYREKFCNDLKIAVASYKHYLTNKKSSEVEENDRVPKMWKMMENLLLEQFEIYNEYCIEFVLNWNNFLPELYSIRELKLKNLNLRHQSVAANINFKEHEINRLIEQLRQCATEHKIEQIYKRIEGDIDLLKKALFSGADEEKSFKVFTQHCFGAHDKFISSIDLEKEAQKNLCLQVDAKTMVEMTDPRFLTMRSSIFSSRIWSNETIEVLNLFLRELVVFIKNWHLENICTWQKHGEKTRKCRSHELDKWRVKIRTDVYESRLATVREHAGVYDQFLQKVRQGIEEASSSIAHLKQEFEEDGISKNITREGAKVGLSDRASERKIKLQHKAEASKLNQEYRTKALSALRTKIYNLFEQLNQSCTKYQASLASDDNESYSTEERDIYLRKIRSTQQMISSEQVRNQKELNSLALATAQLARMLSAMGNPKPSPEELKITAEKKAKEKMMMFSNRLQEAIVQETYKAHMMNKDFIEKSNMDDLLGNMRYLTEMTEYYSEYFSPSQNNPTLELYSLLKSHNKKKLLKIQPSSNLLVKNLTPKPSLTGKEAIRISLKDSITVEGGNLFRDLKKSSENNYLGNVKRMISDAYSKNISVLNDIYEKYNISKEHATVHLKQSEKRFMYYNIQSELVWTRLLKDHINNFKSFLCLLIAGFDKAKRNFIDETEAELNEIISKFKIELSLNNREDVIRAVNSRIKPWHGHPLNQSTLEELQNEAVISGNEYLVALKTSHDEFKNSLQTFFSNIKERANLLNKKLEEGCLNIWGNKQINAFFELATEVISKESVPIEAQELKKYLHNHFFAKKTKLKSKKGVGSSVDNEDMKFPFIDGYQFTDFWLYKNDILEVLEHIQTEICMPIPLPGGEMWHWESPSQLRRRKESVVQYMEEQISPTREIEDHVKNLENGAANKLVAVKRQFDHDVSSMTQWIEQLAFISKELNKLYHVTPIFESPSEG